MYRLLEYLDAEPQPVLSGADLESLPAGALDALLSERLLVELAPLDDLATCECAVDACHRAIHRDGTKAWAICASGLAEPHEMDPQHLRQFRIEVPEFHRLLRAANKLTGEEITPYSNTLCFLGRMQAAGRDMPVVLARMLRPQSAESLLYEVQGRLKEGRVLVLTPMPRLLDLLAVQRFQAAGLVLASISRLLAEPPALVLDHRKLDLMLRPTGAGPSRDTVLQLDVGRSLCHFRGAPVDLARMPFGVLVLLATEAQAGSGWLSRDRIFEHCWHDDWARGVPPNEEQVTKVVSDVRNALRAAGRMSAAEARQLVQTKSKVGYRLNLRSEEIHL
ncbi:MAG: transcriptional regulator [Armatimonadota bacterium]